ncbi:MAG: hypothetical protein ACRCZ6_02140 [Kluyvera sp.]|uniref:hypothetical protein n=1 Tax=Kluyvera sp. TaxID=1538228 RepID=UPI003F3FBD8E
MQLGKKSKTGLRVFIRTHGNFIVANRRGIPRIVVGAIDETQNTLRSGSPSTFKQFSPRQKEINNG